MEMNWSLSYKLLPGEEVLDGPGDDEGFGLKATYSMVLTNKRVIFKFNSLSSGLVQSYLYDHITDARPVQRLLIRYLRLNVKGRDVFMHVGGPEVCAKKIMEYKERFRDGSPSPASAPATATAAKGAAPSLGELLAMLGTLRDYGLLTSEEYEEKRKKLT